MRPIGEAIWIFESPFRMLGAELGNRMTIIRLENNALFVHSPTALDDTLKAKVKQLGHVAYVVTPNAFHGLFVDDWMTAFPGAQHYTAKNDNQSRKFLSTNLSDSTIAAFEPTLKVTHIEGMPKVNEFAFFHNTSRTLVLTDLAFNIGTHVSPWTKIFFSLNGAYGKFGPSRLMRSLIQDRAALKQSLLKIFEWDFDQIVISHGDMIEKNGKEIMLSAFQPYLANLSKTQRIATVRPPIRCG